MLTALGTAGAPPQGMLNGELTCTTIEEVRALTRAGLAVAELYCGARFVDADGDMVFAVTLRGVVAHRVVKGALWVQATIDGQPVWVRPEGSEWRATLRAKVS